MNSKVWRLLRYSLPILLAIALFGYSVVKQYSKLPATFVSIQEADKYAWGLCGPGTGIGFHGGKSGRQGEEVRMYAVEYLFRGTDRVFVVAGSNGHFRVMDDFDSRVRMHSVELKNSRLRYLDYYGKLITEHKAR